MRSRLRAHHRDDLLPGLYWYDTTSDTTQSVDHCDIRTPTRLVSDELDVAEEEADLANATQQELTSANDQANLTVQDKLLS